MWARLLDVRSLYEAHGYGFGALNDLNGPDFNILLANFGQNAENALLQAFIMGGYPGAILWLVGVVLVLVHALRHTPRLSDTVALAVPVVGCALSVYSLAGFGHPWTLLLALVSLPGLLVGSRQ
jgi:hypothetical protein